jgi:hypothetical protein
MRIPEKRLCDLCKAELTGPHVTMAYPLDRTDRERIAAHAPPTIRHTGFLGLVVGVEIPDNWRFEFCRGCVDGFLPMLAELKTSAIQQVLDERQRRAEAPIGEMDES